MPPQKTQPPPSKKPGLEANRPVGTSGKSDPTKRHGGPDARYDMTSAGYGEEAYRQHGDVFFRPGQAQGYYDQNKGAYSRQGQGERVSGQMAQDFARGTQGSSAGQDYWEGVSGKYASRGGPGYTEDAYAQFDKNVGGDAGLDPYYDAAFKTASKRLDRAAAARGQFNSSEALRGQREMATGLAAEQANREADYRLRRQQALMQSASMASGDELAWTQGLGSMAFDAADERLRYGQTAADLASQAQRLEMERMDQGYNAAMGLDQFQVESAAIGMQSASEAQALREGRIQGQFDNQLKLGDRVADLYGQALGQDAAWAQQQVGTAMAGSADKYNIAMANQQQQQARSDAHMNMATNFFSNLPISQGQGGQGSGNRNTKEP